MGHVRMPINVPSTQQIRTVDREQPLKQNKYGYIILNRKNSGMAYPQTTKNNRIKSHIHTPKPSTIESNRVSKTRWDSANNGQFIPLDNIPCNNIYYI